MKVAGVKVAPKNIFIMEESDQFGVIDGLKDFSKKGLRTLFISMKILSQEEYNDFIKDTLG